MHINSSCSTYTVSHKTFRTTFKRIAFIYVKQANKSIGEYMQRQKHFFLVIHTKFITILEKLCKFYKKNFTVTK